LIYTVGARRQSLSIAAASERVTVQEIWRQLAGMTRGKDRLRGVVQRIAPLLWW